MDRVRAEINLPGNLEMREGCTVAVLDSGIARHPDLYHKLLKFKDYVHGKNRPYDDYGHGTHICGIICGDGTLSEGRYCGINPKAKIVMYKILDHKGNGETKNLLKALEDILECYQQYRIKIVNISLGFDNNIDFIMKEKIENRINDLTQKGIIIVCSAGNNGPAEQTISTVCEKRNVITVGCYDLAYAKNCSFACQSYSGRGRRNGIVRKPDLVAPGTQIMATGMDCDLQPYVRKSGTSMATAVVSGVISCYKQLYPYKSYSELKRDLLKNTVDLGLERNVQGYGFLNAREFLKYT